MYACLVVCASISEYVINEWVPCDLPFLCLMLCLLLSKNNNPYSDVLIYLMLCLTLSKNNNPYSDVLIRAENVTTDLAIIVQNVY